MIDLRDLHTVTEVATIEVVVEAAVMEVVEVVTVVEAVATVAEEVEVEVVMVEEVEEVVAAVTVDVVVAVGVVEEIAHLRVLAMEADLGPRKNQILDPIKPDLGSCNSRSWTRNFRSSSSMLC